MQGTVTIGDTYAASLDHTGARLFWEISAIKNNIVIGADASNAFAEAPAPKAPLYMTLDTQYHNWWKSKGRPPIPHGYRVKVYKAIQGHPEAPRLWAKLINKIITKLGFKACKHEPCLYHHPNYKGQEVYFLRQVDDFAISTQNSNIAHEIIDKIDKHMTIKVKPLGVITRFNGIDVMQTKEYIKLSNATYIKRITENKRLMEDDGHNLPIPMSENIEYNHKIETAEPLNSKQLKEAEEKYGFTYRGAIGELLYLMLTCRPDISFPVIKLSQYSTRPGDIHFAAINGIYKYVMNTINDGLYYWRKEERSDCIHGNHPTTVEHNNYVPENRTQQQADNLRATVDSDFANDVSHRKSVTGINIKMAGTSVYYKTKFQPTIALSSTEAEFTAACDAAKVILYIRSILEDLGIDQSMATTLYEDNQGALLMANSGQPTKRTRHIDTKYFALQEWVQNDLIVLKRISTHDNESDTLTKNVGRTLFYRHNDFIMGRIYPEYSTMSNPTHRSTLRSMDA